MLDRQLEDIMAIYYSMSDIHGYFNEFIDSLSSMMRTSKQATTFRLQNLGVITY